MKNLKREAAVFWAWFQKNHCTFEFLHEMEEAERKRRIDKLSDKLFVYSENLTGHIGPHPEKHNKFFLLISCDGLMAYFDEARALTANAPAIRDWEFITFSQPISDHKSLRLRIATELFLTSEEIRFAWTPTAGLPVGISLYIYLPIWDACPYKSRDILAMRIFDFLKAMVGEESFALDIQNFHFRDMEEVEEPEALYPAHDLPLVIKKFRKKHPRRPDLIPYLLGDIEE